MSKEKLLRELQELLDELFTPAIPREYEHGKKGGLEK